MSAKTQPVQTESFHSQLSLYRKQQFTGRLDVRAATGQQWILYLSLGFLVWAAGGVHPIRRWRRQLFRCGHQAYAGQVVLREADEFECWDYHGLTLLSQRQEIAEQQIIAVIHGIISEVLFDIVQAIAVSDFPHQCEIEPRIGVRPSSSHTNILRRKWTLAIAPVLKQTNARWKRWVGLGLAGYSPDWVPAIADPQLLKQKVSAANYQQLATLINGRSPLRDLAIIAKQDVLALAQLLAPYLRQNLLEIREVPDLPNRYVTQYKAQTPEAPLSLSSASCPLVKKGAIACIDDNPTVCDRLEECLNPIGYQVLILQDPVQALSQILKHKPALIFLNLAMPIVSGYELCAQIRRVPDLQDAPIIAIAEKGAIVDRVRAKLSGATDFVLKPIEEDKVLAIAQKYLPGRD